MSERADLLNAERAPGPALTGVLSERLGLVDAVDHLLNRGAVVMGEATISVGGVDLIYLGLNLIVSSVETLRKAGAAGGPAAPPRPSRPLYPPARGASSEKAEPSPLLALPGNAAADDAVRPSLEATDAAGAREAAAPLPGSGNLTPSRPSEGPEEGLARLVLTLVELLRQILERQATRRIEGDDLTDEQVERLGLALMELEGKMKELCDVFGLEVDDLDLDLGPLGQLLS